MPDLIVIYGAPFTGKTTLAWQLGRSLLEKAAVMSTDHLLTGSIAVPDADAAAELEMAHVQLRLLVANYLKNRYHVIVEGPFIFERAGAFLNYEADIDQLIALMRQMTRRAIVVRLTASPAVLTDRARALGQDADLPAALRIDGTYKERHGVRFYFFDTSARPPEAIAAEIEGALSGP
jgi:hypothetical protein